MKEKSDYYILLKALFSKYKIKGNVSMSMLKKIALGALIILTGLFVLPGKAWAADEKVEIKYDGGKLTYTSENCSGKPYTLDIYVTFEGGTAEKKGTISTLEASGNITSDEAATLSYIGADSKNSTTKFTVSGKIMDGTDELAGSVVTPTSDINLYVGQITAASGSTHLSGVDSSFYYRTLSEATTYNKAMVTINTDTEPYYILSKTVGGASEPVNAFSVEIDNKISEGPVVITEGKAEIKLDTPPTTVTTSGYSSGISITPAEAPFYVYFADVSDVTLTSATGQISKADASFNTAGNVLNIAVAGTKGTKATAKLNVEASRIGIDPPVKIIGKSYDFNISIDNASKPESVEIYGEPTLYVGDDPEFYDVIVTPSEFQGHAVTWSAKASASTVASAVKQADGTLKVTPKAPGTVTLTATVDGVASDSFVITILKAPEIVTDVIVAGPTQISKGNGSTATYTAQVLLDTGKKATNQKVTWEVDDDTLASISSTGVLKLTAAAEEGNYIYIVATSVQDDTVYSDSYEVEVVGVVKADDLLYKTVDITKDFTIDMATGKNISTNPAGAAKNIKSIDWDPSDGGGIVTIKNNGTEKVSFYGKKAGSITLTPTVTYTDGTVDVLDDVEFTVRDDKIDDVAFGSGDKLSFKLPDTAYTSYDNSKNIDEVTGYQIDIMKEDGTVLYSVTKSGTDSISIDGDTIEDYIEKAGATGKLSGDKDKVVVRVSPRGKSQKDNKTTVTNTAAGKTLDAKTVYKVSIPDSTYVNGAYVWGLPDHKVTLTASPKSGYKFANWDDGGTSVTRTVTISTDTSKNVYKANANTTGTPSTSSGNGTTPNKNGSNSNLDKVPKTGESMAIYWVIMVAIISASVVAAVLYKYFTPKVRKWRGGDTDGNDNCAGR